MDVNTSLVCVSPSLPCDLSLDFRDDDENLCIFFVKFIQMYMDKAIPSLISITCIKTQCVFSLRLTY